MNPEHKKKFLAYVSLAKTRMMPMVLITTIFGYYLGGRGRVAMGLLLMTLLGVLLVSLGAAALNNYLERDVDALMDRTKNRPLPTGVIAPFSALVFGIVNILFGVFVLLTQVNLLTAFLMLLAAFLYVLVYTPMKRWTWWNTFVGSFPGAIPPVAGWAAATGQMEWGALALFLILFAWQHPHFYSLALLYRKDYERGGFKMLPVVDPDGKSTFRQIILYSVLLMGVSVLPTYHGLAGWIYFSGAVMLGIFMLQSAIRLCLAPSDVLARRLFRHSLVYLPLLLLLIVVDLGF